MAEPALKEVANSIRESNRTSGQFRQAAVEGNKNMAKISKDLYSLFNVQRRENAGIINAINDSSVETQATGAKVERSNSLIQESLNIQQSMLSELKNINIGLKNANEFLAAMGRIGISGINTSKIDPKSMAAKMLAGSALKFGVFGLNFGSDKPEPLDQTDNTPNTNFKAESGAARTSAEKYLGRKMSDNEWNEILKVTHAEAGSNQKEIAGVVATILNRSRNRGESIEQIVHAPNQFSSVRDRTSNYVNGPNKDRADSIYGSITNNLESWSKKQEFFQAANPRAYDTPGDGGNGENKIRQKMEQGWGRVGASIFNTKPTETTVNQNSNIAGIPSGDITALGKALQAQGMRVSEHPDFGGVNPVHKGKAHYEGRALDVNIGRGNVEANDPVLGERFDKLAEQLKAAGYKVIWRSPGHYNHLHVETNGSGSSSTMMANGSEPPAAVSNQTDAPKPLNNSTAATTPPQGSTVTPQKPSEPSNVGTKAFNSVFGLGDSIWGGISPKTILQEYLGAGINAWNAFQGTSAPTPKPEGSNSKTIEQSQNTKAIQGVATMEKVQESKAQEAAVTPQSTSTNENSGVTPINIHKQHSNKEYNGPNDVSIHGDGWTKDLLKYFGFIGKQ